MSAKRANTILERERMREQKSEAFGIEETMNQKSNFKWHLLWSMRTRVEAPTEQKLSIMLLLQRAAKSVCFGGVVWLPQQLCIAGTATAFVF